MWESGSLGVQQKSSNTPLGQKKNQRISPLKRVRRSVSLYPHHLSPKVAQLKAKKDFLGSSFSHRDKVSKRPASPDVGDAAHEAHYFLPHTREKWGLTVTRTQQRAVYSINCFTDSIRRPLLGMLCLWATQLAHRQPQFSGASSPPCLASSVTIAECEIFQMAHQQMQKAGLALCDWEKAQKHEHFRAPP